MSLKINTYAYINFWLNFSKPKDTKYLKELVNLNDNRRSQNFEAYLLADLSQLLNINLLPTETEKIYTTIVDLFEKNKSKKRYQDLDELQKTTKNLEETHSLGFRYAPLLITNLLLRNLSNNFRPHWYQFDGLENSAVDPQKTRTLIELVSDFSESVLVHYQLLYCYKLIERIPNEVILQKYCHIIIRELSTAYNNQIIEITAKDLKDVTFHNMREQIPSELLSREQSIVSNLNKKINIVTIKLELLPLTVIYLGIHQQSPQYITRGPVHLLIGDLPIYCNQLIRQKTTKPHSDITREFFLSISGLLETKLYIDEIMLAKVQESVKKQFTSIQDSIFIFLEKHFNLLQSELNISTDEQLKFVFKKLLIYFKSNNTKLRSFKKAYKVGKAKEILPVSNILKLTKLTEHEDLAGDLALFLLKFNNIKSFDDRLSRDIGALQNNLTRLYTIKEFLSYSKLITKLRLNYVYFSLYCDFRGRVYYHSPVSPQAYWYFRFIYNFGSISRNELRKQSVNNPHLTYVNLSSRGELEWAETDLYLALGVLFKGSCTLEDGRILLSDLIKKGCAVYQNYKNQPLTSLQLSEKEEVEAFYYIDTIKTLQEVRIAYPIRYIFKDTTCSMTQHAGKLLGYRNQTLAYLNLDNREYAYDTYTIYLTQLKDYLAKVSPSIWDQRLTKFITRSAFKNLIMTVEYGVTEKTAYKEYVKMWLGRIDLDSNDIAIFTKKDVFLLFYKFFQEGAVNLLLFKSTRLQWTEHMLRSGSTHFTLPDLRMSNYYYHKSQNIVFYENFSNKEQGRRERHSISLNYHIDNNLEVYRKKRPIGGEYSLAKTKTAAYVNAIHSLDAHYLRCITRRCHEDTLPVITIHDGFGIPFYRVGKFIEIANRAFAESSSIDNKLVTKNSVTWGFSSTIVI